MSMKRKERRNLAVRTFLAANKGKRYTAGQIANFLNRSAIIDKFGFTTREMGLIMSKNWRAMRGVSRVREGNRVYYYWSGESWS